MNETLSALMDAELKRKEQARVLDEVAGDTDLQAAWQRYHVVRAVLRQDWQQPLSAGFSERVLRAVAAEPGARAHDQQTARTRGQVRQYARLALAASVTAVAALFGLHMAVIGETTATHGPLKTVLVAALPTPQPYIQRAHWQGRPWHSRLNTYLLEHSAGAPFVGVHGLPYIRLAAYGGPQPGQVTTP
ncbi:MAG: sigma-E factor negative regulatory protein [Acidiferrobacter sp.]